MLRKAIANPEYSLTVLFEWGYRLAVLLLPFFLRGWSMLAVAVRTPVNLFQTLRAAYGSGVAGAMARTLLVWIITVVSFLALLLVLMAITLIQI